MPINNDMHIRLMAYSQEWPTHDHKKMFGGVCYLMNGNMVCGIHKDYYIFRVGQEKAAELLSSATSGIKPFDITGRPMKGWIMVHREAVSSDDELKRLVDTAKNFVQTLPPK